MERQVILRKHIRYKSYHPFSTLFRASIETLSGFWVLLGSVWITKPPIFLIQASVRIQAFDFPLYPLSCWEYRRFTKFCLRLDFLTLFHKALARPFDFLIDARAIISKFDTHMKWTFQILNNDLNLVGHFEICNHCIRASLFDAPTGGCEQFKAQRKSI